MLSLTGWIELFSCSRRPVRDQPSARRRRILRSQPLFRNPKDMESLKFDKWVHKEAEGILVRYHPCPRRKLFQPTGATQCPADLDRIGQERTTHVQFVGGVSECVNDAWRDPVDGTRKLPAQD